MKLKALIFFVLLIAGLWAANHFLNGPRSSVIDSVPNTVPSDEAGKPTAVREQFTVGFLPVTCHLTCPVTSWVTQHSGAGTVFAPQRFGDFASMKEALIARKIDATFMIAPLAMKLAADGVPVKIVYLGHRDGSALVVATDSEIKTFTDLKGKKVAIPSRFSNQNLLMRRMMKQNGMAPDDIQLIETPPPDHPGALAAKAVDAYIVGEPHCAKAEIAGYGRVLYFMKDLWPNFISCVLVVRQEVINDRPQLVQELVNGIAASGKWLDEDKNDGAAHRKQAAVVVGKMFYNQDPALLEFVLTKPLDRVSYTALKPPKDTFEEIMNLAVETGVIPKHMEFEEYCDVSFAPDLVTVKMPFQDLPMPTEAELASLGKK
ncbi:MAG: ABC transporter substrate-binding protein [Planctomycetes bacterium]|nr:ABC transporter substrate-binding protein [Planctomycetota bacterium]